MSKEVIIEIKDLPDGQGLDGFEVITTDQSIKLSINNGKDCCESWGHFWCNDDPQDFVGSELLSVSITDTALNTQIVENNEADSRDEGGIMFVNLETNRGKLQFVAYNNHNGYYGHTASVECKQLNYETYV